MTSNSTDETLMIDVREGSHAQLGVLFERHHRALYEFFFRMTGIRAVSEDLVQDVFERILKFRDTYRAEGHFKAWLYRIARNAHHDYRKKHVIEIPDIAAASSAMVGSRDMAGTLRGALLTMPEDRRELIVLSQYQGLTSDEIGELLDIETLQARVRVQRALIELRELYRKLCSERIYAN